MPSESIVPKLKSSASEKITAILNRLPIGDAIEAWQEAGDDLHKRINDDQKKLDEHKNKLPKK